MLILALCVPRLAFTFVTMVAQPLKGTCGDVCVDRDTCGVGCLDRRAAVRVMIGVSAAAALPHPTFAALPVLGSGTSAGPVGDFAQTKVWGNAGSQQRGREFAAEAVSRLLQHRGLPTILQLNDAQQLVVQTWVTISCFSLYQDFSRLPDGRAGWERILRRAVDDLADTPRGSGRAASDAYPVINEVLLPGLGDRSALLLTSEAIEEVDEIQAGNQTIGLGVALIQPPPRVAGSAERLKVLSVVPGSRADRSGVRYGDRLLSINGKDVLVGGGFRDPAWLIQGPLGSTVRARFERPPRWAGLGGRRQGRTLDVVLERQFMVADVVSGAWVLPAAAREDGGGAGGGGGAPEKDRVAYVSILTFAGPPVATRVSALLASLGIGPCDRPGSVKPPPLVLDLRGNAGGSLSEAQRVADVLVRLSCPPARGGVAGAAGGQEEVGRGAGGGLGGDVGGARQREGTGQALVWADGEEERVVEARRRTGLLRADAAGEPGGLRMVVLVDRDTASASEALILGLQAAERRGLLGRVAVVGAGREERRTFGKGEAQSRFELSDGSALVLSVARFTEAGFRGVAVDQTVTDTDDGCNGCNGLADTGQMADVAELQAGQAGGQDDAGDAVWSRSHSRLVLRAADIARRL